MIRVIFEVVSALFTWLWGAGMDALGWRGAGNWAIRSWEWLLTVAMQDDLPKAPKDEKMEEQKAQVPVAT